VYLSDTEPGLVSIPLTAMIVCEPQRRGAVMRRRYTVWRDDEMPSN